MKKKKKINNAEQKEKIQTSEGENTDKLLRNQQTEIDNLRDRIR